MQNKAIPSFRNIRQSGGEAKCLTLTASYSAPYVRDGTKPRGSTGCQIKKKLAMCTSVAAPTLWNRGLSRWYVVLLLSVILVHCHIQWITHHSGVPMLEDQLTYTASLVNLPKITFCDVHRLTEQHSITARSKLDKGYSFFFENLIHDYEGEWLLAS